MASLSTKKRRGKTCFEIWLGTGQDRKSIWLGHVSKTQANQILSYVFQLDNAVRTGTYVDSSTRKWLGKLDDGFHSKLVVAGLTKPRSSANVKEFFAEQLAKLKCSVRTRDIYQRAHNKFFEFLDGNNPVLRDVTPEMAHDFHSSHLEGMADSYRAKTAKIIREFFGKALQFEMIDRNPFSGFEITEKANRDRHVFITRDAVLTMMESVSDTRWRCIIGLAGLCGLRTRSEVAELRWEHIELESNTFTVPKCKTAERVVPIFGDFREVLEDYHSLVTDGDPLDNPTGLMFPKCPSQTQLTNRLNRTAKKAGLTPWPKPWMNLRSSVETQLLREGFDLETVSRWLGNSPDVARKHYLQITPADVSKASMLGQTKKSADSPQHPPESGGIVNIESAESRKKPHLAEQKYTRRDSKNHASLPGKQQKTRTASAHSPQFSEIIEAIKQNLTSEERIALIDWLQNQSPETKERTNA